MQPKRQPENLVHDLALLYELSLSTGFSLDVRVSSERFLTTLMRKKNLDFCSLWVRNDLLRGDASMAYSSVFAQPAYQQFSEELPADHLLVPPTGETTARLLTGKDLSRLRSDLPMQLTDGHLWIIPLDEGCFLTLFYKTENPAHAAASPADWVKFDKVFRQFACSLRACLAHDQQQRVQAEILEAKKRAEEAAQTKQRFLATMSHEIRTPLNAIIGMSKLMEGTALGGKQAQYLHTINFSANHLLGIVDNLLDLSKVEAGQLVLEQTAFDLGQVLEDITNTLQNKAEEKGLQLRLELDPSINRSVLGDPLRLSQILLNLLDNGIKFTDHGTVNLTASLQHREVGQQQVRFDVQDTGKGIPPDKIPLIFTSFAQEDSSISRRYGGTGLGLTISKQLTERMGGTLSVLSTPGEGSCFRVELNLPPSKPTRPGSKTQPPVSGTDFTGRRVLLVEDNMMNQFFAQHLLEGWKLKVDLAANGREAVQQFEQHAYDLVLMDIQMPEMDGLEATQLIRRQHGDTVPIIALTAMAVKEEVDNFHRKGLTDYLLKPFVPKELQQKLMAYLPSSTLPVTSQTTPDNQPGGDEPLYRLDYLTSMLNNDRPKLLELIRLFVVQSRQVSQQLTEACGRQDWSEVGKLAHKIKASLDMLEVKVLKQPIRQLEALGKEGKEAATIEALCPEVCRQLETVCDQIEARELTD